mgnify:CR=1 FL=1
MKIYKTVLLSFIIIWMVTIFIFSHQPAKISSNTSGDTIRFIINHIPIIKDYNYTQKEEIVELLQPIVRKLAHLSIYVLGGVLLFTFANTYNIEEKNKISFSALTGILYAITDELHQLFIPRTSWTNTRCYYRFTRSYLRNSNNGFNNKNSKKKEGFGNKMKSIQFSPPDIEQEEIEEVIDTLKSGWITTGPKTKQFEVELAKYCHTNKVVALNSATAALEMTLHVLGIGQGDEVIVPAYTYTASCSPICHLGATPILVDIQKDHFEMDYEQLEKAITSKTKVIIPVDIAGILCDYDKIYEIVEKKKSLFHANNDLQKKFGRIIVVADCAHGIGARKNGKMAGEFADFTTFSFHAVKNLTTAEGGAATWKRDIGLDDEAIYKRYQILSLHGQTKDALAKTKLGSWEYDILEPAYKCNMTDINAAIGIAQLRRYPNLIARRHEIIRMYQEGLKNSTVQLLPHITENSLSSGHLYLVRINDITEHQRNEIIVKMAENGIATNVHYKPLPLLTAYKKLGFKIENYPNAYDYYHNEITLPLHSKLTNEEVSYIIEKFVQIIGEKV